MRSNLRSTQANIKIVLIEILKAIVMFAVSMALGLIIGALVGLGGYAIMGNFDAYEDDAFSFVLIMGNMIVALIFWFVCYWSEKHISFYRLDAILVTAANIIVNSLLISYAVANPHYLQETVVLLIVLDIVFNLIPCCILKAYCALTK